MKVYINNYRDHWLSPYTILEKVVFWREIDYDEPVIERWSNRLEPFCKALQKVLDVLHPRIQYVKIDRWDTWSMDATLGQIALPMLKQLRDTKHGAPWVEDDDVPEELRSTAPGARDECENEWDTDANHFKRWDWVLDEMIFAFEHILDDKWKDQFYSGVWDTSFVKVDKTYLNPVTGKEEGLSQMVEGPNHTYKCDYDGMRVVEDRIQNGFRLFGKYYQSLWD